MICWSRTMQPAASITLSLFFSLFLAQLRKPDNSSLGKNMQHLGWHHRSQSPPYSVRYTSKSCPSFLHVSYMRCVSLS